MTAIDPQPLASVLATAYDSDEAEAPGAAAAANETNALSGVAGQPALGHGARQSSGRGRNSASRPRIAQARSFLLSVFSGEQIYERVNVKNVDAAVTVHVGQHAVTGGIGGVITLESRAAD